MGRKHCPSLRTQPTAHTGRERPKDDAHCDGVGRERGRAVATLRSKNRASSRESAVAPCRPSRTSLSGKWAPEAGCRRLSLVGRLAGPPPPPPRRAERGRRSLTRPSRRRRLPGGASAHWHAASCPSGRWRPARSESPIGGSSSAKSLTRRTAWTYRLRIGSAADNAPRAAASCSSLAP